MSTISLSDISLIFAIMLFCKSIHDFYRLMNGYGARFDLKWNGFKFIKSGEATKFEKNILAIWCGVDIVSVGIAMTVYLYVR